MMSYSVSDKMCIFHFVGKLRKFSLNYSCHIIHRRVETEDKAT